MREEIAGELCIFMTVPISRLKIARTTLLFGFPVGPIRLPTGLVWTDFRMGQDRLSCLILTIVSLDR